MTGSLERKSLEELRVVVRCCAVARSAGLLVALGLIGGAFAGKARAQWADVPRMDANGDFQTTKVLGNKGYYQQMLWLVVDRDREGLNCRPADGGDPLVKLDFGGILLTRIEAADTNAITMRQGQPWLNVTLTRLASPVLDLRQGSDRRESYHCQVRANADLIAPINLSAVDELRRSGFAWYRSMD